MGSHLQQACALLCVTSVLCCQAFPQTASSANSPASEAMIQRIDSASQIPAPWYVREILARQEIQQSEGGKASVEQLLWPQTGAAEERLLATVADADAYLTIRRLHAVGEMDDRFNDYSWIKADLSKTGSTGLQELLDKEKTLNQGMSKAVSSLRTSMGQAIRQQSLTSSQLADLQASVSSLTVRNKFSEEDIAAARRVLDNALNDKGKDLLDNSLQTIPKTADTLETRVAIIQQAGISVLASRNHIAKAMPPAQLEAILPELGALQRADKEFVSTVLQVGDQAQAELAKTIGDQKGEWKQIVSACILGPATGPLEQQIRKVQPFLARVSLFTSVINGQESFSGPASLGALKMFAQDYAGPDAVKAAEAVIKLGEAKDKYAAAANVIVGALAQSSPEIKQFVGAASQVAQFIQAAGPLVGIAGFSSGLGALSLLGGFGGLGGSNTDPAVMEALKNIQESLNRIESKLDQALVLLKGLQSEIRANHEQVMSALESLGYDVERTRRMLQSFIKDQKLGVCDVWSNDPRSRTLAKLNECNLQLTAFYNQGSIQSYFSIRENYKSTPNGQTALDYANALKVSLAKLLTSSDSNIHLPHDVCTLLRQPAGYYLDLSDRPSAKEVSESSEVACVEDFDVDDFIDPGGLAELVIHEQDIFRASADQAVATQSIGELKKWWADHNKDVSHRWLQELTLLNLSIAQQQLLNGDFLLPQLGASISKGGPDLDKSKDLLNPKSVLGESIVRSWVYGKMSGGFADGKEANGNPFSYAVAYGMPTPILLNYALNPSPGVIIKRSTDCTEGERSDGLAYGEGWFVSVSGKCFALPSPRQVETGELTLSSPLRTLIDARSEILMSIEGIREATEPLPSDSKAAYTRAKSLVLVGAK